MSLAAAARPDMREQVGRRPVRPWPPHAAHGRPWLGRLGRPWPPVAARGLAARGRPWSPVAACGRPWLPVAARGCGRSWPPVAGL